MSQSAGTEFGHGPAHNQLEVTVIGPGYGECICIHAGNGEWLVIDSSIDSQTKVPFPIRYLTSLGVDLASQVKLLVATHWHDDHTRGLSECLLAFESARFCLANVLTQFEFAQFIKRFQQNPTALAGSRVREIDRVLEIIKNNWKGRIVPRRASQGKIIHNFLPIGPDFGLTCTVTSLSPSDLAEHQFLRSIAEFLPQPRITKTAVPDISPNDASVVLWIAIGPHNILLGADLEEDGTPGKGWNAVITADNRPDGLASVFKVPHHGSITGHHPDVWRDLVQPNAIALVAPWAIGGNFLPQASDVSRLRSLTPAAFQTAPPTGVNSRGRHPAVLRTLKEIGAVPRLMARRFGAVRLRTSPDINRMHGPDIPSPWCVELLGEAFKLEA